MRLPCLHRTSNGKKIIRTLDSLCPGSSARLRHMKTVNQQWTDGTALPVRSRSGASVLFVYSRLWPSSFRQVLGYGSPLPLLPGAYNLQPHYKSSHIVRPTKSARGLDALKDARAINHVAPYPRPQSQFAAFTKTPYSRGFSHFLAFLAFFQWGEGVQISTTMKPA